MRVYIVYCRCDIGISIKCVRFKLVEAVFELSKLIGKEVIWDMNEFPDGVEIDGCGIQIWEGV